MTSVFATAVLGAANVSYGISPVPHHVLAWIAVVVNMAVAGAEYRAIARNGRLIDDILARITSSAVPAAEGPPVGL
jgi:hypothetical protein